MGARYVEQVRGLLRRELRLNRDDSDGVAVGELPEHFEKELERLSRNGHALFGGSALRTDMHPGGGTLGPDKRRELPDRLLRLVGGLD